MIPPEAAEEHGKWRTGRAEYTREMMDIWNDPQYETIVYETPSQIAKSEIIINQSFWTMKYDPGPMAIVQPSIGKLIEFSKTRFNPSVRDTESIRKLVKENEYSENDETIKQKFFPGGFLIMLSAGSNIDAAGGSYGRIWLDEVDRFELTIGRDGDPVRQFMQRTTNFSRKKVAMFSTPTDDQSKIHSWFELSDKRLRYFPCPGCGFMQTLSFNMLIFDAKNIETCEIGLKCEHCGDLIPESKRGWMDKNAEWRKTAQSKKIAGFKVPPMVSPWVKWRTLAKEFLESKGSEETLRTFWNLKLGDPRSRVLDTIDTNPLILRRESYKICPKGVLILVAAVDQQDDRLEFKVKGYGKNNENWLIDYHIFWGNTKEEYVWKELDRYWSSASYPHELGMNLRISAMAVDTGGHATDMAYSFCKPRFSRGVIAIKGKSGSGIPIISHPSRNNRYRCPLFFVGIDSLKATIMDRLKKLPGDPGYMHFPEFIYYGKNENPYPIEKNYFDQLTSEVYKLVNEKGKKPYYKWDIVGSRRNEALDVEVYSIAALTFLNPDFNSLEKIINAPKEHKPVTKIKRPPKKNWVTGF